MTARQSAHTPVMTSPTTLPPKTSPVLDGEPFVEVPDVPVAFVTLPPLSLPLPPAFSSHTAVKAWSPFARPPGRLSHSGLC